MIKRALAVCLALAATGCVSFGGGSARPLAEFERFSYRGMDAAYTSAPATGEFFNPIVAGFYPDPSVVRVGEDFYLVHSSFTYVPGIPVLHSRNLVDWRIIGHAYTRDSQINFDGASVSRGLYAPTIRYHDGVFYIVTTGVDGAGGNQIVTARDAAGPWSDPISLPQVDGIDPDLFFDDDGRVYLSHNGPPPDNKPLYDGHRAIYLWEFDLNAMQVVGSPTLLVNGGVDIDSKPVWIEGPHIYKIDGWYYLWCAEGGTAEGHSEVVFRSRAVTGPYQPHPHNPILTQRDLDPARPQPVVAAGHADLVQTPTGEWWAVFLGMRPYQQRYVNTGRETFLLPVTWRDGWPYMLPPGEAVPLRLPAPKGLSNTLNPDQLAGNFTWEDEFDGADLQRRWAWLRTAEPEWWRQRAGRLHLVPQSAGLAGAGDVAFLGKRQQHLEFEAELQVRPPAQPGYSAGLAIFQNEQHHYYLGLARDEQGNLELFLEQAAGGDPVSIAKTRLNDYSELHLQVTGREAELSFRVIAPDGVVLWQSPPQDARVLSTQLAGGFVGTVIGPHSRLH